MACKMTTYKDKESNKQTYITVAEVLPMSLLSATSHTKSSLSVFSVRPR